MPFEGHPPAPEVTDLVGEGVPEVAADIAVQQVRRPLQARGRRQGLADEARRPLGERHVAQPPLERVPVALRQHEPGAVRRLAAEAGHVVVLAQRHRRGVDLGGQPTGALDRSTQRDAKRRRGTVVRVRPASGRARRKAVGVLLGHLGERAHVELVATNQPSSIAQVRGRGGQRGQVPVGVVARVAAGRRRLRARCLGLVDLRDGLRDRRRARRAGGRPVGHRDGRGGAAPASAAPHPCRRPRRGRGPTAVRRSGRGAGRPCRRSASRVTSVASGSASWSRSTRAARSPRTTIATRGDCTPATAARATPVAVDGLSTRVSLGTAVSA